jgi:hypothetical protein
LSITFAASSAARAAFSLGARCWRREALDMRPAS